MARRNAAAALGPAVRDLEGLRGIAVDLAQAVGVLALAVDRRGRGGRGEQQTEHRKQTAAHVWGSPGRRRTDPLYRGP